MSTPALNDASPTGTHAVPLTETPEQARRRQRRMALAAVVGTAVEWYDFYLYAAMASIVFATVFFPEGDSKFAALQSLATFAVGFLARPVGGVVFGALGDRIGRKRTLVVTFILMGVSTGVIGFLPDFATIGMWALSRWCCCGSCRVWVPAPNSPRRRSPATNMPTSPNAAAWAHGRHSG